MRRGLAAIVLAGAAFLAAGCAALLDWNNLSGGSGDAGAAGDSAGDAHTLLTCAAPNACVAAAPSGWSGPVALYSATASAAPACGAAFAATPSFDGNATLTAPQATCSACGCGAPSGVTCAGPVMTFFTDDTCQNQTSSPITVTSTCTITPFSVATTVAAPAATGGTCTPSGGAPTKSPPAWADVARACTPATPVAQADCATDQVCMPAPAAPYATTPCVMQAGVATACPAGYPAGPQVFYAGVDDKRDCTPCQCAGPAGGACASPTPAINACTPPGGTWTAPGTCTPITGPEPVKLAGAPTLVDAGACTLTGGGVPSGAATPSGATSFCCTQ